MLPSRLATTCEGMGCGDPLKDGRPIFEAGHLIRGTDLQRRAEQLMHSNVDVLTLTGGFEPPPHINYQQPSTVHGGSSDCSAAWGGEFRGGQQPQRQQQRHWDKRPAVKPRLVLFGEAVAAEQQPLSSAAQSPSPLVEEEIPIMAFTPVPKPQCSDKHGAEPIHSIAPPDGAGSLPVGKGVKDHHPRARRRTTRRIANPPPPPPSMPPAMINVEMFITDEGPAATTHSKAKGSGTAAASLSSRHQSNHKKQQGHQAAIAPATIGPATRAIHQFGDEEVRHPPMLLLPILSTLKQKRQYNGGGQGVKVQPAPKSYQHYQPRSNAEMIESEESPPVRLSDIEVQQQRGDDGAGYEDSSANDFDAPGGSRHLPGEAHLPSLKHHEIVHEITTLRSIDRAQETMQRDGRSHNRRKGRSKRTLHLHPPGEPNTPSTGEQQLSMQLDVGPPRKRQRMHQVASLKLPPIIAQRVPPQRMTLKMRERAVKQQQQCAGCMGNMDALALEEMELDEGTFDSGGRRIHRASEVSSSSSEQQRGDDECCPEEDDDAIRESVREGLQDAQAAASPPMQQADTIPPPAAEDPSEEAAVSAAQPVEELPRAERDEGSGALPIVEEGNDDDHARGGADGSNEVAAAEDPPQDGTNLEPTVAEVEPAVVEEDREADSDAATPVDDAVTDSKAADDHDHFSPDSTLRSETTAAQDDAEATKEAAAQREKQQQQEVSVAVPSQMYIQRVDVDADDMSSVAPMEIDTCSTVDSLAYADDVASLGTYSEYDSHDDDDDTASQYGSEAGSEGARRRIRSSRKANRRLRVASSRLSRWRKPDVVAPSEVLTHRQLCQFFSTPHSCISSRVRVEAAAAQRTATTIIHKEDELTFDAALRETQRADRLKQLSSDDPTFLTMPDLSSRLDIDKAGNVALVISLTYPGDRTMQGVDDWLISSDAACDPEHCPIRDARIVAHSLRQQGYFVFELTDDPYMYYCSNKGGSEVPADSKSLIASEGYQNALPTRDVVYQLVRSALANTHPLGQCIVYVSGRGGYAKLEGSAPGDPPTHFILPPRVSMKEISINNVIVLEHIAAMTKKVPGPPGSAPFGTYKRNCCYPLVIGEVRQTRAKLHGTIPTTENSFGIVCAVAGAAGADLCVQYVSSEVPRPKQFRKKRPTAAAASATSPFAEHMKLYHDGSSNLLTYYFVKALTSLKQKRADGGADPWAAWLGPRSKFLGKELVDPDVPTINNLNLFLHSKLHKSLPQPTRKSTKIWSKSGALTMPPYNIVQTNAEPPGKLQKILTGIARSATSEIEKNHLTSEEAKDVLCRAVHSQRRIVGDSFSVNFSRLLSASELQSRKACEAQDHAEFPLRVRLDLLINIGYDRTAQTRRQCMEEIEAHIGRYVCRPSRKAHPHHDNAGSSLASTMRSDASTVGEQRCTLHVTHFRPTGRFAALIDPDIFANLVLPGDAFSNDFRRMCECCCLSGTDKAGHMTKGGQVAPVHQLLWHGDPQRCAEDIHTEFLSSDAAVIVDTTKYYKRAPTALSAAALNARGKAAGQGGKDLLRATVHSLDVTLAAADEVFETSKDEFAALQVVRNSQLQIDAARDALTFHYYTQNENKLCGQNMCIFQMQEHCVVELEVSQLRGFNRLSKLVRLGRYMGRSSDAAEASSDMRNTFRLLSVELLESSPRQNECAKLIQRIVRGFLCRRWSKWAVLDRCYLPKLRVEEQLMAEHTAFLFGVDGLMSEEREDHRKALAQWEGANRRDVEQLERSERHSLRMCHVWAWSDEEERRRFVIDDAYCFQTIVMQENMNRFMNVLGFSVGRFFHLSRRMMILGADELVKRARTAAMELTERARVRQERAFSRPVE